MKLVKLLKVNRLITLSRLTSSPGVLLRYALLSLSGNREGEVVINNVKLPAWVVSRLIDAVSKGYNVSVNGKVIINDVELPLNEPCELGMMLNALLNNWKPQGKGEWGASTVVGNVIIRHVTFAVVETFNYGLYDFNIPHEEGDWLIDIGANIGDSATFFAKLGFRVLAVEPVPSAYEEMLENLMLNDVVNKVKAINAAYSLSHSAVKVNDYDCLESTTAARTSATVGEVTVPGFDLRKLLEYTDWKARVLKVDCEGCEKELATDPLLPWFKDVLIESPDKDVHRVLRRLGYRLVKVNKHPSNPDASVYYYAKV